jgi:hypothetical protein
MKQTFKQKASHLSHTFAAKLLDLAGVTAYNAVLSSSEQT